MVAVSVGFTVGYQYIFPSGWSLSAFSGLGIGETSFTGGYDYRDRFNYDAYGNSGFGFDRSRLFGVSVGYFFQ
jgi:hypothetical protein